MKNKKTTLETGGEGEDLAESFLKSEGFRIVERNFRCKGGEVDLIVWRKEEIHFVEVKARGSKAFGDPLESIGEAKQRRISQAAQIFLLKNPVFDKHQKNFSVITVNSSVTPPQIEFIPNAFEMAGNYY